MRASKERKIWLQKAVDDEKIQASEIDEELILGYKGHQENN